MLIPFDTVDYDSSGRWNAQAKAFDIVRDEVWEVGATVTTYSWIGERSILHIVDLTNNQVIKSVISTSLGTNPGDYEVSISIDCVYKNGSSNIRLGVFIEGLGYSWRVAGDYGPAAAFQPSYGSVPGSLTYFWMHRIA